MKNAILVKLDDAKKLLKYVGKSWGSKPSEVNFDYHAPDCDGAVLSVDKKSGLCTLVTWQESGHNGDMYGRKESILSPELGLKALDDVIDTLKGKALEKARKEALEELADNMATAKLKSVMGKR